MYCQKCGTELPDGSAFCASCGAQQGVPQGTPVIPVAAAQAYMQTHDIPKCTCCGYVGEFKYGPLLTGKDILWFLLLLCLAGAGFIFLLYKLITRGNKKNREKICPKCRAKNMYTYLY